MTSVLTTAISAIQNRQAAGRADGREGGFDLERCTCTFVPLMKNLQTGLKSWCAPKGYMYMQMYLYVHIQVNSLMMYTNIMQCVCRIVTEIEFEGQFRDSGFAGTFPLVSL